jgi:hypothetical protein
MRRRALPSVRAGLRQIALGELGIFSSAETAEDGPCLFQMLPGSGLMTGSLLEQSELVEEASLIIREGKIPRQRPPFPQNRLCLLGSAQASKHHTLHAECLNQVRHRTGAACLLDNTLS